MGFFCPGCSGHSLQLRASLELKWDSQSDEITLHLLACADCSLRAIGAYEESRRGGLDSDCWRHGAHRLEAGAWEQTLARLASCPAPQERHCNCPVHQELGCLDAEGKWCGLEGLPLGDYFTVKS